MIGLLARNRRAEQRANRTRQMRRWQTVHARLERMTFNANVRFFRQIEKNVVRRFEDSGGNASADDLFRPESWEDEFNNFMIPRWNQTIWTGVKFEADYIEAAFGDGDDETQRLDPDVERILLEGDPPPSIYVEPDEQTKARIRTWLRGRAVGVWNRIGETTKARIRRSINKGLRDGLDFNKMADLLRADLAGYTKAQARRVARTETTGAINNGQYLERKQLGIEKKIWIMRQDVKVRQPPKSEFNHWKAHRQVQLNDEPFVVSNERLMYPGDSRGSAGNVINCRCSGLSHFEDKPARRGSRTVRAVEDSGSASSRLVPKGAVDRNVPIADRIKNEAALKELRDQITSKYKSLNQVENQKLAAAHDEMIKAKSRFLKVKSDPNASAKELLDITQETKGKLDRFEELKAVAGKANDEAFKQSQKIFDELGVVAERRGRIDITKSGNARVDGKAKQAQEFLESITDKKNLPEDYKIKMRSMADDYRADAEPFDGFGRVNIGGKSSRAVQVHEMGHTLEFRSDDIAKSTREFLEYRLQKGGKGNVYLADEFPEYGYNALEVGNSDEFDKLVQAMGRPKTSAHYIGKQYDWTTYNEILSMGVEYLYRDPVTFAKADPEYFDFIIGVLRGVL